jgi:hypothetical protein
MPDDKTVNSIEELIRDKKFSEAEAFCRGYLSGYPYDYDIRFMLARILEASGKWDDAIEELLLIKRYSTSGSKLSNIEDKIEQIKDKKKIYEKIKSVIKNRKYTQSYIGDKDFVQLTQEDITIGFHIKDQSLHIEEIFRVVKRAQAKIYELFKWTILKVNIDIYNSKEDAKGESFNMNQDSWIAGIYDDKIQIFKDQHITEPQYIYTVITHEYAHLAMQTKLNNRCPWWLNEGFAVYFSQSLSNDYKNVLLKAAKNSATIPFESLEKNPLFILSDELIRLAYAQSASIVDYLFSKYGKEVVAKKFIGSLKQKGITYALNGIGLNYYLLERDWIRWVISENHEST